MAPRFEDRPECKEAVGTLREPGISPAAIVECLQTLYNQHGGEEAWTTIKAQNYKRVRKLLDGKKAKKAKLMDTNEDVSGPSEAQLAEAEVLCDLMAVPQEYLRRVLADIYQNYGGQPEVWAVIKGSPGDPEGLWGEVIKYIEEDSARPSPPVQDPLELPFDELPFNGLPQPSGGGAPSIDTTKPRRPIQNETSNPAERSSSHSSAEPLRRATRDLSPRGHRNGLHRMGGPQEPKPDPQQQALVDEVEQKSAGLAPHHFDTPSPSLRGEPAVPSQLPGPQCLEGPLLDGTLKWVGATSGRWDAREKHPGGAQLLEPTSSLAQHAAFARKSQEATEESQRKRRREREHQAELRTKVRALQRAQQSVDGAASGVVPERREGNGAEEDSVQAVAGLQTASAGRSEAMEMERDAYGVSAGLQSPARGPEGSPGGALEQALRKLREVGSNQVGGSERPGDNEEQQANIERGGCTSDGAASEGRNVADGSAAVKGKDFPSKDGDTNSLNDVCCTGGESDRLVANGEERLSRRPEEQLPGVRAGVVEALAHPSGEDHARTLVQEAGGADGGEGCGVGTEEGVERRKLKRIRKVGERPAVVNTRVDMGRESMPVEKLFDEKERSPEAVNRGCEGDKRGAVGVRMQEQAKGSREVWGPTGVSKARTSKHKSLNAIVQAPDINQRDEKGGQQRGGRAGVTWAVPLTDVGGRATLNTGVERGTNGYVTGENGLKEGQAGVAANAAREGTGAGAERVVSEDVSRGLERHKIRCVNAVNDEVLPKGFRYMRESKVFQDAQPHAPSCLALLPDNAQCDCEGNCLDAEVPCACTIDTRGCYAYDKNGRLDSGFLQKQMDMIFCPGVCLTQKAKMTAEERLTQAVPPCDGHRMFIKECSIKCRCHMACGNRVVQRGIAVKLEVFWAVGKGWAVRCLDDLPPGTFVCEYVGEILTTNELHERNQALGTEKKHFPVELNACPVTEDYIDDKTGLCLDATKLGNVARFFNHRCEDATLIDVPVEIEGPRHNYYHIAFFTNCFVRARTELTWDYGLDFTDEKHPIKAFECRCGSAHCRG